MDETILILLGFVLGTFLAHMPRIPVRRGEKRKAATRVVDAVTVAQAHGLRVVSFLGAGSLEFECSPELREAIEFLGELGHHVQTADGRTIGQYGIWPPKSSRLDA